ncbi:MAG: RluA family pseudouridine synthase [Saprospiraceae bacterium]
MLDLRNLIVIYEDNHLIAVNKLSGLLVHGDETGDITLGELVKEYIRRRYDKPGDVFLGTIHRIDRPTSGTVVFARTSKALERMNKMFAEQKVIKTYYAVTRTRPNPLSGTLSHWLLKDSEKNITKAFDAPSNRNRGAKEASLDYELAGDIDNHYLLKVNPHTGRQHQIRSQLFKAGYPILGDLKYGSERPHHDGKSIYLHCFSLEFEHPVTKAPVKIESPFPEGDRIWQMFAQLIEN